MKLITHLPDNELATLLKRYNIRLIMIDDNADIPGSYWGAPEAGIITNNLYVRNDTPVHSALHESCHFICMDQNRRETLHTDTGGDYDEENAVCYLQIILSDFLSNVGQNQLCKDMDDWGYTFRLGSAQRWFEEDAEDALKWLISNQILNKNKSPSWKLNS